MPHFSLEYTTNLSSFDAMNCLAAVNATLADSGHFEEGDIKSRAQAVETFRVGMEATGRAFIAARLAILSGRSPGTKQELSQRVLQILRLHLPAQVGMTTQLSVEIVDIDRPSYAKAIIEA